MPIHYTADYDDPQGTRFHCCVERSADRADASIDDIRQVDARTGRPLRSYWDIVDNPEVGRARVQRRCVGSMWQPPHPQPSPGRSQTERNLRSLA